MNDELLRLECLKLVLDKEPHHPDPLKRAEQIFDWLQGRGQTAEPDNERPFKDYKPE